MKTTEIISTVNLPFYPDPLYSNNNFTVKMTFTFSGFVLIN